MTPDPLSPRLSPLTIRAAWWTWTALRRARSDLREQGLETRVPPPPPLPWAARRGVLAVLRRVEPTCLERALVLQSWLAAHDREHDVVIGVATDSAGFRAHAWIESEDVQIDARDFTEIHRITT